MPEQDYKPSGQDDPKDELDRVLNSALAMLATVEARSGLEDRIVANLHIEESSERRRYWGWGFAAAVLALAIIALAWHTTRQARVPIVDQVATPAGARPVETGNLQMPIIRKPTLVRTIKAPKHQVPPENPKLDQFPSPRPLSEQEQLLAMYINEDPEHAALIAEARMENLRQDEAEKIRLASEEAREIGRSKAN